MRNHGALLLYKKSVQIQLYSDAIFNFLFAIL